MRAAGFEAHHFRGGLRQLVAHARERAGGELPDLDVTGSL